MAYVLQLHIFKMHHIIINPLYYFVKRLYIYNKNIKQYFLGHTHLVGKIHMTL